MTSSQSPKPGAVRFTDQKSGQQVIVNPGEKLYALATMLAEFYFDGETWFPADPDKTQAD